MTHGCIKLNKIFVCDYVTVFDGERAEVVKASVLSADGTIRREYDSIYSLYEGINNLGAVYVFVWDMSMFGCFCDYWALKTGLKTAADAERANIYGRVNEECFSVMYAAGRGVTNFRLTLRRTAKTHNYGSGRKGGLHTVEYRGMNAFFSGMKFADVAAKCGGGEGVDALCNVFNEWARIYTRLAGEDVLTHNYMRKVYTIGGAAKRKYLKTRYGKISLSAYQKEHPQVEALEDYYRERHLLLSGACFFPDDNAGKLYDIPLKKYDVNSLYTYIADTVGELGTPEKTDFDHFIRDRTGEYAYIIVVRDFCAYRKRGAPPVFQSPFKTCESGTIIQIKEQFAMFRDLWDALHKFYLFEDFEVMSVMRCKIIDDPHMRTYNEFFEHEKMHAEETRDALMRKTSKLFMNNLIGKFVQKTKYIPITPVLDRVRDMVVFERGDLVDNWERGHFDYIRGAYIYTKSRVKIMNDIYKLLGKNAGAHHFYTDTDSIVTDIEFPPEIVDGKAIGKYKIEREYTYFGVIGKKIYYGYSPENGGELTCAGVPKGLCLSAISETYGELSPPEVFRVLTMDIKYSIPRTERVSGGAAKIYLDQKISEIRGGDDL